MGYDMNWVSDADEGVADHPGAVQQAERSYFRLNVWGMGRYREWMAHLGMVHDVGDPPPFPALADYGLTQWPDRDDERPAAAAWREATDEVLAWAPEVPGIPVWKLGSNDGWIVTPVECLGALHKWEEAGRPNPDSEEPGYWLRWIDYLRGAAAHGGFRVY